MELSLKNDDVCEMLDDKEGKTNRDNDLAMMALTKYNHVTKHIWLADSGASSHMCIQDDGMFNVKMVLSKVTIGNSKSRVSPFIWMTFQTKEGKKMFLLEDVKYVPELCVNLQSITKALQKGFQLSNKDTTIILKKLDFELSFDKLFQAGSSHICGIELAHYTWLCFTCYGCSG